MNHSKKQLAATECPFSSIDYAASAMVLHLQCRLHPVMKHTSTCSVRACDGIVSSNSNQSHIADELLNNTA